VLDIVWLAELHSLLHCFHFRIQHCLHTCFSWIMYKTSLNSPLRISHVNYCLVQWLRYLVHSSTDCIATVCKLSAGAERKFFRVFSSESRAVRNPRYT